MLGISIYGNADNVDAIFGHNAIHRDLLHEVKKYPNFSLLPHFEV